MKSSIQIPTSNFSQLLADYKLKYVALKNDLVEQHSFLTKIYVTVELRGPLNMVFIVHMNLTYNGKFATVNYHFNTTKVLLFCVTFCCAIGVVFYIAWATWFGFIFGGFFSILIYRAIWIKINSAVKKFEKELRKVV